MVFPDLEAEAYLFETFQELGYITQSAMGESPLDLPSLDAYCSLMHIDLESWEIQTLRKMSRTYLAERSIGEDPLAMPPHERDQDDAGNLHSDTDS